MTSKMQYLVSLSDEIAEKLLWLEGTFGETRDKVISDAIEHMFLMNHPLSEEGMEEYRRQKKLSQSLGEAAQKAASSIAITLLQQTLDEGRSIHIPSLGITIEPEKKE